MKATPEEFFAAMHEEQREIDHRFRSQQRESLPHWKEYGITTLPLRHEVPGILANLKSRRAKRS